MKAQVYSIKEAAYKLGISRAYLYYLKDIGRIEVQKIGSQYVISESEVERYKRENGASPRSRG